MSQVAHLEVFSVGSTTSDVQIVLCHGFGASNRDLVDLAHYLDPQLNWGWHFPQGPVSIPGYFGFAWFPRTKPELDMALGGAYFSTLEQLADPGLADSATEISAWVHAQGLQNKRIVFGGFSQGAMVALQASLQASLPCVGLVLLSSALIDAAATNLLLDRDRPFPVFQSHGTFDTVLSMQSALSLRTLLQKNKFEVEWHQFAGGHEIPIPILGSLKKFLGTLSVAAQG